MKVAILHIRVIELTCPNCGEYLGSQNGSHMFDLGETLPEILECDFCDVKSKMPVKAFKLQE